MFSPLYALSPADETKTDTFPYTQHQTRTCGYFGPRLPVLTGVLALGCLHLWVQI